MTATTPTAKHRRLAPVACCTVAGEPDGIHLSVEEWAPQFGEWITGMALCGQSAEQGALPPDTPVTCAGCEGLRDRCERALAGRPTVELEQLARVTAQRDGLAAELAEWHASKQHGAFVTCGHHVRTVTMEAFARKISEKRDAIAQRAQAVRDAQAFLERARAAEATVERIHDWASITEHGAAAAEILQLLAIATKPATARG